MKDQGSRLLFRATRLGGVQQICDTLVFSGDVSAGWLASPRLLINQVRCTRYERTI